MNEFNSFEDLVAQAERAQVDPLGNSYFQFIPAKDLYLLPRRQWLLEGHIIEGGLHVLFAPSGAGKSFVALDYYALPIAQKHPVIYFAAEGHYGYAARVAAWEQRYQLNSGKLYFQSHTSNPISLVDANSVGQFIEASKSLAPKLVVFDTLAWCMSTGDENSAKDMGLVMAACRRIQQELNTAVLLVHHTGKSGASERGSSALRGAADIMMEIKNRDGLIELSCSKSKDHKPFDTVYFRLMSIETPHEKSCLLMPAQKLQSDLRELTPSEQQVLEFLNLDIFRETGAKTRMILADTGIPEGSIHRILNNLKRKGYIRQGGKWEPYLITEEGIAAILNNHLPEEPSENHPSSHGESLSSSPAEEPSKNHHNSHGESLSDSPAEEPSKNHHNSHDGNSPLEMSDLEEPDWFREGFTRSENGKTSAQNSANSHGGG